MHSLVNTLVNSFLREVNTLKALRVYTPFLYLNIVTKIIIHYVKSVCMSVDYSNYSLIRYKLFTKPFTNYSLKYSF